MSPRRIGVLLAAMLLPPTAVLAQSTKPIAAPGASTPQTAIAFGGIGEKAMPVTPATPLPVGGVREAFQLVSANTPSIPVKLYGGDYILSQLCGTYGTFKLEVLGADGLTWLPLVTKTASDSGSGTGVALGSFAMVRGSVNGTSGCYASLSRVPA
ncbi:hypothetical protein [Sphingomonas sp. SORGH_AS_0879]|uniref:hypothetical protein n=1 Tax=Sphingomonas sp. SORGH_AS_0879 TaxID=3041790 RepID=UPI002782ACFE|nr:hypothetical protein [Sphingomonas sp. SORGH_AS_0879]MDQ1229313.1 hypothetical protein [Sphingomonas sp. SORGH_AS_0879]